MPTPRGGGQPAADVARILDNAGIPSILWGWLAIALYGRDKGMSEVDFVIPDEKVEAATNALIAHGFTPCGDAHCSELHCDRLPADDLDHWDDLPMEERLLSPNHVRCILAEDRFHPVAAVHFHIQSQYAHYHILALHRKSYLLWSLPDFGLEPPAAEDRNLMLSNTPHMGLDAPNSGSGPWENLYPMKVLTPWACAEALILVHCRDEGHLQELDSVWRRMLFGLMVRDWQISRYIGSSFQEAWGALNGRRPDENAWRIFRRLRDSLIAHGELPELPPHELQDWT
ncbi:uncharacterized protein BJX67DRAFT_379568 [Aspergillus lucknowensis]|uniref:Nucleotidyltransferase family protein n=1 Tax=Aspergillus lucknowensis TaxID=176173 RepID=A0ABR4LX26_9EURO